MLQLFKMAYRNLGRNRRRTFFSVLAVAVALALLLMIAAILEGEMRGAIDLSIRLHTGHLQIRAKSYEEEKLSLAWDDLVENPEQIVTQLEALEEVKAAAPRLNASGIIATRDESVGVQVIGIDPLSETNEPFYQGMVAGEYLTPDDREGVIIGLPLAEKLDLKVGDTINLLVNTSNGDVDEQLFTIRGLYSTGTPGYDKSTIFMPLAKAQTFTRTEGHASLIFILLNDIDQTDAVAAALQSSQYKIETWREMNKLFVQMTGFANVYMAFLNLIVLGVTATVITNTLLMAVFERTREMGILTAIGMKGRQLIALFMAEAGFLAVGGIIFGLLLGWPLVAYYTKYGIYFGDMGMTGIIFGDTIYAHLTVSDTVILIIMAFVITLLAALYPAIVASRLEPVEALHS
ncbi:MAG: ABC transporter permease [Chloroflexi bacterium]|nr:ABC transporter permease [Chloroflexota bacterium]